MNHIRSSRSILLTVILCSLCLFSGQANPAASAERDSNLMPVPFSLTFTGEGLAVDSGFSLAGEGYWEPRLTRAAVRFVERLSRQTGIIWLSPQTKRLEDASLILSCSGPGEETQSLEADESYRLDVSEDRARLSAPTPVGILRGLETILQLVEQGGKGYRIPGVTIEDRPRFPWRGLLIDPGRHWLPVEVIKRNLEGMAAVKLNVLHWHLSEDQGFRVESRRFPRLHEMGSDGLYYTQKQVRDVVNFARDLGIRVVPEFDMPGHSTAWFVGYPELASAPGPYQIERCWGVKNPCMDPTREETYDFLEDFIGEMAELFPDDYFHIGGDEVNGRHWNQNSEIDAFKKQNGMRDNHDLQAYFNRRVLGLLKKHEKKMVGWDEIFHPDLPKDAVIQSWRGQESLAQTARDGYMGILSNGYYLDHILSAEFHYGVEPLSDRAEGLTEEEKSRILGGEACMWGEFVAPETIDSRIWPRLAAVAERFWSPVHTRGVEDMYRRLDIVSQKLEWLGLQHRSNYRLMLQRLTDGHPVDRLQTLADIVEPVKYYSRPGTREYTQQTPFNRLVDAARPESRTARMFRKRVQAWINDPLQRQAQLPYLRESLNLWRHNHGVLAPMLEKNPALQELSALSKKIAGLSAAGLDALEIIQGDGEATDAWFRRISPFLDQPRRPEYELDIRIAPGIRRLIQTAFHERGGPEYSGLVLLAVDAFRDPRPFGWDPHPPKKWEIREEDGLRALHLLEPGTQGKVRAPTAFALLRDHDVSDFVFSGRIRCQEDPENPNRDMIVVFHFQDPTHFYYVHLSASSDGLHNIIGLVDGKDRVKINLEPPGGSIPRLTDREYHDFKVTCDSRSGDIRVFLDDMESPILTARDKTLGHGLVGVGSFDDTGSFTEIVLWGKPILDDKENLHE